METINKLPANVSLVRYSEPLKGIISDCPVPVVTIGYFKEFEQGLNYNKLDPHFAKYIGLDEVQGIMNLHKHLKSDTLVAIYENGIYRCITKLGTVQSNKWELQLLNEPFNNPLVKLGNSYIQIIKKFIRSAKVEGLVCLTADEEVDLGLMDGDEIPHDEDDRPLYLGCITDDPKIQNDEAQVLGGSYDLYIHKDESIEMIWGPNEIDGSYKGIGTIIERLFEFSTLNPNN